MYEAMRQRAPGSSKLVGVTTTAMALAAAGYAFMVGFAPQIAKALEEYSVTIVPPPVTTDPPPVDNTKLDTNVDVPLPPPPIWMPPIETIDTTDTITASPTPAADATPGPVTTVAKPVRVAPKMRPGETPTYPATEERAQHHGISAVQVCIDERGRVMSASLARSSGYPKLDEAALKWVRGARFFPGTVDGVAQPMCGHNVSYEWKLETATQR